MTMTRMGVWVFTYWHKLLDSVYRGDKFECKICKRTVIADIGNEPYRTGTEALDLANEILTKQEEHYHIRSIA